MPRVSEKDNNKENNIYGDDNQLILEPTMDFVFEVSILPFFPIC